jgi:hypothetical protein
MKVERFCGYNEDGSAQQITMRILRTACPLCRKSVEFIMNDEDFIAEEHEFLRKQNDKLRDELSRLIIDNLVGVKVKE